MPVSFTSQPNDQYNHTVPNVSYSCQVGIRFGDFYPRRLIEDLGLASQNGVVWVSMAHYNTLAEVDRLIDRLASFFVARRN